MRPSTATGILLPGNVQCRVCGTIIQPGKIRCPRCREFNPTKARSTDDSGSSPMFRKASEIEAAKYNRLSLGPVLDDALSGGIAETQTVLFAGEAGGGKTTSLLMSIDHAVHGLGTRNALFITGEQSEGEVVAMMERCQVKELARINIAEVKGDAFDLLYLLEDAEPGLVIVDSIQTMCGTDAEAILFARQLKGYAKEYLCPGIVVCHLNKEGEPRGAYDIEHETDCTLVLTIGAPKHLQKGLAARGLLDDDPRRTLHAKKNRMGRAPRSVVCTMTETGLLPWTAEEDDDGPIATIGDNERPDAPPDAPDADEEDGLARFGNPL